MEQKQYIPSHTDYVPIKSPNCPRRLRCSHRYWASDQFLFLEAALPCGARQGPAAHLLPPARLPRAHPGLLPELLLRILKNAESAIVFKLKLMQFSPRMLRHRRFTPPESASIHSVIVADHLTSKWLTLHELRCPGGLPCSPCAHDVRDHGVPSTRGRGSCTVPARALCLHRRVRNGAI